MEGLIVHYEIIIHHPTWCLPLFFSINSVTGDMFLILHFVSNVLWFLPENTVHQSTTIKLVRYIKKGHSSRWWFLVSTICVMFIPGEMIKIMILTCASFSTGWLKDCQTTTYVHTLYVYIYIYANCCQHFSNKMLFEARKRGWCLFVTLLSLPFERGDSCFPTQLLGISLHDYVDRRHFWS